MLEDKVAYPFGDTFEIVSKRETGITLKCVRNGLLVEIAGNDALIFGDVGDIISFGRGQTFAKYPR